MVIMDLLEGYKMLHQCAPLQPSVLQAMEKELQVLHEAGYVHGDIRDTNIMASENDPKKFMFIDFDWAGKVGEVRYPVGVNFTEIIRPSRARDGELINIYDDQFMFRRLRGQPLVEKGDQPRGAEGGPDDGPDDGPEDGVEDLLRNLPKPDTPVSHPSRLNS